MVTKIPVILDTDIGGDIDDTWALAYLLKCPELDLRLIVCSMEDTTYKAKIVAKLLEVAGRTDIPIAIGPATNYAPDYKTQVTWVKDYELQTYPGTVHANGVAALVRVINDQKAPPTLIGIGPLRTVAVALALDPTIPRKCHFVGMHGSIRRQHQGQAGAIAEWNVVQDVEAAKMVLHANWLSTTLTPLDTCGVIRLSGENYSKVRACKDPLTAAVLENYRLWSHAGNQFEQQSSILFDTVAVFLAFSRQWLGMEQMHIRVTDDGFTRADDTGYPAEVALHWKDQAAFETHLVERLISA